MGEIQGYLVKGFNRRTGRLHHQYFKNRSAADKHMADDRYENMELLECHHLSGHADSMLADTVPARRKPEKRVLDATRKALVGDGCEIVGEDWSGRFGWFDFMASTPDGVLVFCEVCEVEGFEHGFSLPAVSNAERARYERMAADWLQSHDYDSTFLFRFDRFAYYALDPNRCVCRRDVNFLGNSFAEVRDE